MNRLNPRAVGAAIASFLACLGIFLGATGPLRTHGGDILVVVLLVAALAGLGVGRPTTRLVGVGLLSMGVEALQGLKLVGRDAHPLVHATLGSTFDPVDLGMYALGLALAALLERSWRPAQ